VLPLEPVPDERVVKVVLTVHPEETVLPVVNTDADSTTRRKVLVQITDLDSPVLDVVPVPQLRKFNYKSRKSSGLLHFLTSRACVLQEENKGGEARRRRSEFGRIIGFVGCLSNADVKSASLFRINPHTGSKDCAGVPIVHFSDVGMQPDFLIISIDASLLNPQQASFANLFRCRPPRPLARGY